MVSRVFFTYSELFYILFSMDITQVGEAIRKIRGKRTIAQFCRDMQVTAPVVYAWERGKSLPKKKHLADLGISLKAIAFYSNQEAIDRQERLERDFVERGISRPSIEP